MLRSSVTGTARASSHSARRSLDQHEAAAGEQQPDRDEEGRHLVRRGHEHEDRREEDDPPPLSPPEVAEQRQRDQRHEDEGEEGDPAPDEHASERRREQVRDRGERGDETAHAVAAGEPPHQHVHGDAGREPGENRQCLGGRLELEQGGRDPDRNGDERRAEEAEAGRVSLEDLALGQQVVPDVRTEQPRVRGYALPRDQKEHDEGQPQQQSIAVDRQSWDGEGRTRALDSRSSSVVCADPHRPSRPLSLRREPLGLVAAAERL